MESRLRAELTVARGGVMESLRLSIIFGQFN